MTPEQRILLLNSQVAALREKVGPHRRDDQWEDADLHVGIFVLEELQGAIDGVNPVFTSTFTPVRSNPYMMELLFIRGAIAPRGTSVDGWTLSGRRWILVRPPSVANGMTDMRPIAFYQRLPGLVEAEFDPATMMMLDQRRRKLERPARLARQGHGRN